ncbi:MAG: MlaD family protein, partial [Planctomycetota bacterium]
MQSSRLMRIIAALTLTALITGAATLMLQTHSPHFFKASKKFHFYMRKAHGVEVGTPVWVNGLEAGEVIKMELMPEEKPATLMGGKPSEGNVLAVKATARIYSPFHRQLREESKVEVLTLAVLGRPRVHVFPSPPGMDETPNNDLLSPRIERGIEGKAEELISRANRVGKKGESLQVYLDALQKDSEEIDERYKKGRNTFKSMVQEGEDRRTLEATSEALQASTKRIQEVLKEIGEDKKRLGDDPLGDLQVDLNETGKILGEVKEELEEA